MTRGQYIAMCIIGAVAIIAYLQSQRVAQAVDGLMAQQGSPQKPGITI